MTPEESEPDIAARGIDRRLLDAGPRPADDHLPGIPEGEAVTLEDLRRQKNEWYAHHAGRDSLGGLAERERETLADLGFAVRPRPLPAYYTAERHDWVSQQGWELRYLPETRERERQYAIGEGWVLFAGSVRDDTLFDRTIQGALLAADLRQAYQDLPFRPRRVDEWERVPEWLERFAPDYLSPFPGRIPEYPVQVASAQEARPSSRSSSVKVSWSSPPPPSSAGKLAA